MTREATLLRRLDEGPADTVTLAALLPADVGAKAADAARARRKRVLGLLEGPRAEGLVRLGGDGLWRRV